MVSVPWRRVCGVSTTEVWMRAALTCSAMKLVRTTRKNTGTEICQPLPLDFSIHSMIAAEIGPASTQYQVAPTSRKSGAASVSVSAVTCTIIPCWTCGPTTWGPTGGSRLRCRSRRAVPRSRPGADVVTSGRPRHDHIGRIRPRRRLDGESQQPVIAGQCAVHRAPGMDVDFADAMRLEHVGSGFDDGMASTLLTPCALSTSVAALMTAWAPAGEAGVGDCQFGSW